MGGVTKPFSIAVRTVLTYLAVASGERKREGDRDTKKDNMLNCRLTPLLVRLVFARKRERERERQRNKERERERKSETEKEKDREEKERKRENEREREIGNKRE